MDITVEAPEWLSRVRPLAYAYVYVVAYTRVAWSLAWFAGVTGAAFVWTFIDGRIRTVDLKEDGGTEVEVEDDW